MWPSFLLIVLAQILICEWQCDGDMLPSLLSLIVHPFHHHNVSTLPSPFPMLAEHPPRSQQDASATATRTVNAAKQCRHANQRPRHERGEVPQWVTPLPAYHLTDHPWQVNKGMLPPPNASWISSASTPSLVDGQPTRTPAYPNATRKATKPPWMWQNWAYKQRQDWGGGPMWVPPPCCAHSGMLTALDTRTPPDGANVNNQRPTKPTHEHCPRCPPLAATSTASKHTRTMNANTMKMA